MALPANIQIHSFPKTAVESAIRKWWANEEAALRALGDPFNDLSPVEGTVFDILPSIPSHQAVEVVGLLEKILDRPIPETVVKRGGYTSPEEFIDDMIQKLEALPAYSAKTKPSTLKKGLLS